MEKWNPNKVVPTAEGIWTGREVDNGPFYFYECVCRITDFSSINENSIVLAGYPCDEGVRRNQGRVGAKDGPEAIKSKLAKTAFNHSIYDLGDVDVADGNMEEAQSILAEITQNVIEKGGLPINIGGGHDVAFGTGMGVYEACAKDKKRIGIVNFDAHFDLRKVKERGNSGTPFYQLSKHCKAVGIDFNYHVLGIQMQSNTEDLFKTADDLKVDYYFDQDLTMKTIGEAAEKIVEQYDVIYLSIDLDVFSAGFAPGVSAINPMGISPEVLLFALGIFMRSHKVVACDIAEMNPEFDQDGRTAKLAAFILNEICRLSLEG